MAGSLTISTLKNDTGVLAVQNGMTGIAKAWVNFTGAGGATINTSFNVSSVTYVGTGQYTVNLTTAMPSANYSVVAACNILAAGVGARPSNIAVGSFTLITVNASAQADGNPVCAAVFSS